MRPALLVHSVVACLALSGCFHFHRGDPERLAQPASPVPAELWPSRDAEVVRPLLAATPDEIFAHRPGGSLGAAPGADGAATLEPEKVVTAKGIYGAALVREVRPVRQAGAEAIGTLFGSFGPNAYVLTSRGLTSNRARLRIARHERTASEPGATPSVNGAAPGDAAARVHLEEGVPVRFPDPLPESPRGVLIHLWALMHNRYEERTVAEFARRGWAVVEIDSVTSAMPDIADGDVERILALEEERDAIIRRSHPDPDEPVPETLGFNPHLVKSPELPRYLEILTEINALEYPDIDLCTGSDVDGAAAHVARLFDDAGAENAYAAEAALDHLLARRPGLAGLPVVIIGFSAGALSAPAAAVRLRDRIQALVLVGSAANVAGAASRSKITRGGITYRCEGRLSASDLIARVAERYLVYSRLDPYQLGPYLRGLPVLHVHAPHDEWVPSDLARLLNRRLGGPDRLVTMFGGHKFLFYFLPNQAGRIADWVERVAPVR